MQWEIEIKETEHNKTKHMNSSKNRTKCFQWILKLKIENIKRWLIEETMQVYLLKILDTTLFYYVIQEQKLK